jgi:hypothetical protein
VNALNKIALAVGEDKLPSGGADSSAGLSDRQKALDIVSNPNNALYKAYHNPNDPQHEHAVAVRSKFNESWVMSQKGGK